MIKEHRREFRRTLLLPTLQHAVAQVPGYRRLWSSAGFESPELTNFDRLPLTNKDTFARAPDQFRDVSVPTGVLQHTGGTTRRPLLVQRGTAEIKYIWDFFTAVIEGSGVKADQAPLCIAALGNFHGDPTPMPYSGPIFRLDVNDTYWDLHTLFSDPTRMLGRPVSNAILVGLESQLRILTGRLIESGFDFTTSVVRSIHSTGDLITSRLRSFYESTWRCALTSRYSMSEVIGGAELCSRCNYYHCDTHIVGEVVHPTTGRPIESGLGTLVLTALFPFVQKQPIIRYRTGDLVELGPRTCSVDELAFVLKGREIHAVLDSQASGLNALLLGAELYDLLDEIPDVALGEFRQMFRSLTTLAATCDLGHLKYKVTFDTTSAPRVLLLRVELRYAHYFYPERSAEVLRRIRAETLARHPYLAEQVRSGAVELRVSPALPGSLSQVQVDETE